MKPALLKPFFKKTLTLLTIIKYIPVYEKASPILKKFAPPILWERATLIRDYLHNKIRSFIQDRSYQLELHYRARNIGLQANTIQFRPDIKLQIYPRCRNIFEESCYIDPAQVDEMDCFLEATKERKSLLDIGALYGTFSLPFAVQCPAKKVLAIEASPLPFARLLYNIKKNELTNITAVECALSNNSGYLAMHYEREHVVAAGTKEDKKIDVIHIPMITGDQLCQSQDFKPDVIKIDVEGHEIKVLKGLTEVITKYSPLIFLEIHPHGIEQENDSLAELEDFFTKLDYSATLVNGTPFLFSSFRNMKRHARLFLKPKNGVDKKRVSEGKADYYALS